MGAKGQSSDGGHGGIGGNSGNPGANVDENDGIGGKGGHAGFGFINGHPGTGGKDVRKGQSESEWNKQANGKSGDVVSDAWEEYCTLLDRQNYLFVVIWSNGATAELLDEFSEVSRIIDLMRNEWKF